MDGLVRSGARGAQTGRPQGSPLQQAMLEDGRYRWRGKRTYACPLTSPPHRIRCCGRSPCACGFIYAGIGGDPQSKIEETPMLANKRSAVIALAAAIAPSGHLTAASAPAPTPPPLIPPFQVDPAS